MTERYRDGDAAPKERFREGGLEVVNLSGLPWWEVKKSYSDELLEKAKRLIVMPDFNPGRSPLPTGSIVRMNTERIPGWRRYAVGDIGCGMSWLKTELTYNAFVSRLGVWDEIAKTIQDNEGKPGDLGSGNHFLDAVTSGEDGFMQFVIHTGSRDESTAVDGLVNDPEEFDEAYSHAMTRATINRKAVMGIVRSAYKKLGIQMTILFDNPHNLYVREKDEVVIYKGANRLKPGQLSVIPSHMAGPMALVRGSDALQDVEYGLLHGTGRATSRKDAKAVLHAAATPEGEYDFSSFRLDERPATLGEARQAFRDRRIYVPPVIPNRSIGTESPDSYRPLGPALNRVRPFISMLNMYRPVAYIGQL